MKLGRKFQIIALILSLSFPSLGSGKTADCVNSFKTMKLLLQIPANSAEGSKDFVLQKSFMRLTSSWALDPVTQSRRVTFWVRNLAEISLPYPLLRIRGRLTSSGIFRSVNEWDYSDSCAYPFGVELYGQQELKVTEFSLLDALTDNVEIDLEVWSGQ